jgi:hypothetical protein
MFAERNSKESNPQLAKRVTAVVRAVDIGWHAQDFSTVHIRESDKRTSCIYFLVERPRRRALSGIRRCHETFIKSVQAEDVGCKGSFAVPELAPTERVLGLFL